MRKLLVSSAFAVLASLSSFIPAKADEPPMDGNKLNEWCTQYTNTGPCIGYLLGAWDSMTDFANYAKTAFFCPAGHVDGEQLRLVFVNATRANPAGLSMPASTFVFGAYTHAFPCANNNSLQGK